MAFPKIALLFLLSLFFLRSEAIVFNIRNHCSYTLWPAIVVGGRRVGPSAMPDGGRRLDAGQTWTISSTDGPKMAKIWARTNCTFDASGRGSCQTGDCNGQLQCQTYGSPPHTVAEYGLNSFGHKDLYDISLMEGFNVPMEFRPTSNGCTRPVQCKGDIVGECPNQLRAPGGCHNPCTVYKTTQYCCHAGACRPTDLSRFFKSKCRDCFTYPQDDPTSTFTCPPGTNYDVVFCP